MTNPTLRRYVESIHLAEHPVTVISSGTIVSLVSDGAFWHTPTMDALGDPTNVKKIDAETGEVISKLI